MSTEYRDFLASKVRADAPSGFRVVPELHPALYDWQAAIVGWALRRGRAALFEDCGLGKTIQQLVWASNVPGNVLLLTPLAVAAQTEKEAARFGIDARVSRDGSVAGQITVANYENMHRFDVPSFDGIVLDESSILKSHDGKTRTRLIEESQEVPWRLACTATPAPNDHMELGNHAEFLGVMSRAEMLASFFVHDGGSTQHWRLKGHARAEFWEWVASWAVMVRSPADIGYQAGGFNLPPLRTHETVIRSGYVRDGELFAMPAVALSDQRAARRETIDARVDVVAEMVNSAPGPWVIWCELNAEGDALEAAIDGAVQVTGSMADDEKAATLTSFADGASRVLVTKPSIAGFGMNWQHCHQMAFVGLSHSWEQFYQAVRRCWRYGQTDAVDVHIVETDVGRGVLDNIKRKQAAADEMAAEMVTSMAEKMREGIHGEQRDRDVYAEDVATGDGWTLYLGDCVERLGDVGTGEVGYSIFSPPFASLYTYSNSERDMGNCADDEEFMAHLRFLVAELFRVTQPGRLVSFHCMDLPTSKARDGFIGQRDFRGALIRAFEAGGFILHSQVCIWKDPVTAMQRTKALGLLYKQLRKDSCMSRQGIPDYLVTMRKPGQNAAPVGHTPADLPLEMWQRYASPVWMDINPSDTLQFRDARDNDDERHICPLQIGVVERALHLWSNPGDLVLSPFAGIGTEGWVAVREGRRFVGIELKPSYFAVARDHLNSAAAQLSLFA